MKSSEWANEQARTPVPVSGHIPIPANESELYNEALRNVALAGLSSMSEGMVKSKSMAKRIAVLRKSVDAACGAPK